MKRRWLLPAALAAVLAVSPTVARATLLFSGGEDVDFACGTGGTCTVNTTSGMYRANWAREAVQVEGSIIDPPTNRLSTPVFSATAALWAHAQFCINFGNSCTTATTTDSQMLRIIDSNGNAALVVSGTGTAGQVKISSRTSGGVLTDLATCSLAINATLTQLDLYVNYGTSGEVALYSNSAQVCDYTGDVTNGDGATTLNRFEFGAAAATGSGYYRYGDWSEIIIATTDTRAMSRFTANTVADGNTTGFSGTSICSAMWNATAFDDNNFAYSGSTNVTHECTVRNAIPAGAYNVVALVMSARALVGTSGPLHFNFVTRTDGTDYTSADFAPTNNFSNISNYIQSVNPATSSAWALSDFTASGFNVGEKTKP